MQNNIIDLNGDMLCCALTEISGIANYYASPLSILQDLLFDVIADDFDYERRRYKKHYELSIPDYAHIIFTQARRGNGREGYGYNLQRYIEDNNLGTVVVSVPAKNPNSRNHVVAFVWTVNRAGIKAWAKTHTPKDK